jgi:hypothetical protein
MSDAPLFFAAEITVYVPSELNIAFSYGHGSHPHGAFALEGETINQTATLRASDTGYVSRASDPDGVQPYRPSLTTAFVINRRIALNPASDKVAAAWGTIALANTDGFYNSIADVQNSDGRPVVILAGQKTFDASRGLWVDPAYSSLVPLVGGVATPWFCDDTALQIPLRDASYWLSQPLQAKLYAGNGGLEGGDGITESLLNQPNLLGLPKPMARGGTSDAPILNITPVLVDAVNLIYQYNDGPGTVVGLSVNGLANAIAFESDVADLYVGTTTPGYYRTCNAKGLFQLGAGTGQLTADVTGAWPDGAAPTTGVAMALQVLLDDAVLPADLVDEASFTEADTLYPYPCGYFVSTSPTTANDVVASLLASVGASLMPKRTGKLGVVPLRALASGATPEASYDESTIISLTPTALGPPLDPPPYRWRVGVQRNWTIMNSGLNDSLTVLRRAFLGQQYTTANWGYIGQGGWSSPSIQLAYTRPSDPALLESYITTQAAGTQLAADLGGLWSVPGGMSLYSVKLPLPLGMRHEIGAVLKITWPSRNLGSGKLGQVVGEQVTSSDSTTTLLILISNAQ